MYLCICICVFGWQTLGNIVFEVLVPSAFQKYITSWFFSKCFKVPIFCYPPTIKECGKLYLCICVFVCVYLDVRHLGTLFLRSSYHLLFKNISHHGSFQGFSGRKLCGANNQFDFADFALLNMGWVGWGGNLCVHQFYRALSVIINVIVWNWKVKVFYFDKILLRQC